MFSNKDGSKSGFASEHYCLTSATLLYSESTPAPQKKWRKIHNLRPCQSSSLSRSVNNPYAIGIEKHADKNNKVLRIEKSEHRQHPQEEPWTAKVQVPIIRWEHRCHRYLSCQYLETHHSATSISTDWKTTQKQLRTRNQKSWSWAEGRNSKALPCKKRYSFYI